MPKPPPNEVEAQSDVEVTSSPDGKAFALDIFWDVQGVGGGRMTTSLEHRVSEIYRPTWTRMLRAVVLLERLATGNRKADALAVLKKVAEGHPDAQPTKRAKEAVKRLTASGP